MIIETLQSVVAPLVNAQLPSTWPGLLTWAGLGLFIILSVMRGWWIPARTHEREIKLLTDRIREVTREKDEWRAASQADQAVAQETRAQHRLLLETGSATTYALEGMRRGLEQAMKEDHHE